VSIETEIVVGDPAEQIVHRAETTQVDLIVMGRRGMSTFNDGCLALFQNVSSAMRIAR
jgi:nucleotide-binding universal stress UspA family protein